ncbi:hypothetical protein RJ639_023402 [Escallonia herrerae]|uniref:Beta-glucosidase n=1 Tax=Escallonia herrerae TaxID=1293975 RepID=A0AA89ADJ7_9ASTE|nr:hypothetical protein RJ639_023402 [Escallonia herrerae]
MATPVVPGATFRHDFPEGFLFGASTSAFQIEGAVDEGGRGPSIWDTFARDQGLDGWQEGTNHYHRYEEDLKLVNYMGLDSYRFSISWSRVLPTGKLSGGKNQEGITFYNNLINKLLAAGIIPVVTLSHWDIPQGLDDEYGGFLSPDITKDFLDFANLCFTEFGDRVKYWITFCGPWSLAYTGYGTGTIAPGRGASSSSVETFASRRLLPPDLTFSRPYRTRIHRAASGDPGTEPYLVGHHQLLAHAAAVKLYRENYESTQKGKIGIILQQIWPVALTDSKEDRAATQRSIDYMLGWFMDPLYKGDYPDSMKDFVGSRLPSFKDEESKMVRGSYDFIALNYYTATYVRDAPDTATGPPSVVTDPRVAYETERDGGGSSWIRVYPVGIQEFMVYMKEKYDNPAIFISENGIDEMNDPLLTLWESLTDHWRVSYYQRHLSYLRRAITDNGVNVKGYFIWSLTDNFEWAASIYSRFGNVYIDYDNGHTRNPKLSAEWFRVHLLNPTPTPR